MQVLLAQERPVEHIVPHDPQLLGSELRSWQAPLQFVLPLGHEVLEPHCPLTQEAPVGQAKPQDPPAKKSAQINNEVRALIYAQLFGFDLRSKQTPLQTTLGAEHEVVEFVQLPMVQSSPEPHE